MPTRTGAFTDRIVLVSGAGRGIGRALAEAFAAEGASLFLFARTAREVEDAAKACRRLGAPRVEWTTADQARTSDMRRVAELAQRAFGGPPDVLLNNAGELGPRVPMLELNDSALLETLKANVVGLTGLSRSVAKAMRAAGRGGVILTITGDVAREGHASWPAHMISKFALEGVVQAMADEWRGWGLRVIGVNPGAVATALRRRAFPSEDPAKLVEPPVIAPAILFLAGDGAAKWTGVSVDAQDFDPDDPLAFLRSAPLKLADPRMPAGKKPGLR